MRWLDAPRERFRALFSRSRLDMEMDEELRFHLDREMEFLRDGGLDVEEARRRSRARFGGLERVKEEVRQARGIGLIEDLGKDLQVAVRGLSRRPGFALGVVLTLGLGIGATTTVYSIVDGVVLRRLPYDDPSTLVAVGALGPGAEWVGGDASLQNLAPLSVPNYLDLRERARSFDELAAVMLFESDSSDAESPRAGGVSPEVFEMLGASPVLGRTFLPEDAVPMTPQVALLTYGAWRRRYGEDSDVVGRPVEGAPVPLTIVGVLPHDFTPAEAFVPSDQVPEIWLPIPGLSRGAEDSPNGQLYLLGRLERDVSVDQARAETGRIAADLAHEFPMRNVQRDGAVGIGVNDLQTQTVGTTGRSLGLFLGAAGLLLMLAAMNAGTLLLARSLERTAEYGVRMALGAGRTRIVRLLVAEAGLLAAAGGALGVLLALGGVGLFLRFAPPSIPRLGKVAFVAPFSTPSGCRGPLTTT